MAKMAAIILGAAFILIGLAGFLSNNFLGAHLTPAHNIIHLVSGAAALYLGLRGSLQAARLFGFGFGAVYLLLGVVGYWMGGMRQTTNLPPGAQDNAVNENMFRLIPGVLEFGTVDHLLHVLIGLAFIVAAALTRGDTTRYTEANRG